MLRKLLLAGGMLTLSFCCFSQSLTRLEGEDAVPLGQLSRNGRYALGSIPDVGIFMYDLSAKEMIYMEGSYYADGVSDNGIYVGNETVTDVVDDEEVQTSFPVYFRDGEAFRLPLPPADTKYTDGSARGINADGSLIVGYVCYNGDVGRVPCIWTKTTGESYSIEMLPTPGKDLTNRKPQGMDALRCSDSGDLIVGRIVDWSGFYSLMLTWTKNGSQGWDMKELGRDVLFKEGAVIPAIPDIDELEPKPMEYFTPEDSATYKKAIQDYKAGLISDNPAWNKYQYITNPDSIAKYNEAAVEFNKIFEVYLEKTEELEKGLTGKTIDVYSLSLSANGNYIGSTCTWEDPESGGDEPMPLMKDAKANGQINAPLCFDLKAGKWEIKDFVKDGIVDGVTNDGNIFYATPNLERTRTSFVIPAGTNDNIDVAEWVKIKTNGKLDMRPDFIFSYEYNDNMTGQHVVVTDSLIVGDVFPSANGRILLGTFYSPVSPEIITYYVDMDNFLAGIENTSADKAISVYPNPVTDLLYIKGHVENVSIFDLSGHKVYETSSVSGAIPVGTLGKGTYLVKIKNKESVSACKIIVE